MVRIIFFFFQAEDGIRDTSVTGVQTCALPIYLIQNINDEGNTILVVTHEEDIAHMCKRIVHLKDGVIVEDKKVEQVRASEYVQ